MEVMMGQQSLLMTLANVVPVRLSNVASLLTVYQAAFLRDLPECPSFALRTELDAIAQLLVKLAQLNERAQGRSIASLVVARRQLWLSQARVQEPDKAPLLDAPISPGHTFGPAVEEMLQRSVKGARILSGVEEGAYGWITINYLLSSFIKYSYEGKWLHPKNGKILGALNMGGASTQITFTPEGWIADKQTEASFCLYGYIRTQESLQTRGGHSAHLARLVVFSAFFYTFDFLKLAPQSSLDVTKKTTEEFCKRDWSSLKTDFPTEKENNLREYCATSYYITTLLADAYKFDNQSWNKIVFEKKADDADIGWMLGYTLNLTNLIPTETPLKTDFPTENENNLREYCATSYYITTLLADAYKFDNQSWNKIVFEKKADDTNIGWMLVYTLNLTNLIPTETPAR
ncbi:UNVERIFIED_CONTAM: hypothetical protein FKN15_057760 [Acipenser sinensis]